MYGMHISYVMSVTCGIYTIHAMYGMHLMYVIYTGVAICLLCMLGVYYDAMQFNAMSPPQENLRIPSFQLHPTSPFLQEAGTGGRGSADYMIITQ